MSEIEFPEFEGRARVGGGAVSWNTETAAATLILFSLAALAMVRQFIR